MSEAALEIRPITRGQRTFVVGHSFHGFIVGPLATLAAEAGIAGHVNAGTHFIGGSTPMQHWEAQDEATNSIKVALRGGEVDVLTLASNALMPEPGVDHFADLAYAHNPKLRLMIQQTWNSYDAKGPDFKAEDRDLTTQADLDRMRGVFVGHGQRMRAQIQGIRDRHHTTEANVVPVAEAVIRLREAVLRGEIPGVTKQTQMFRDALGHARWPVMDVTTYTWFAALYRRSPVGLKSIDAKGSETSTAQHRVLQEIAWASVRDEPMSGVG